MRASESTREMQRRTMLDGETAAWVVALPCALASVALIVVLGPPLAARAPQLTVVFWPDQARISDPERLEHARFLLSLAAPILLSLATVALARRPVAWPAVTLRVVVVVAQASAVALVVACIVAQYRLDLSVITEGTYLRLRYFSPATLAVAAVLAGATVLVLRGAGSRARAVALLRESRARRWAAVLVAVAATAVWLLHAIDTDTSTAWAASEVRNNVPFPLDETFAVLNGRTPLVDFTAQYSNLWPFVTALSLTALGTSLLAFTATMCVLTALGQLAIFGVLRRVTRSSVAALALYLPFLATSFFMASGDAITRYTPAGFFGVFPLRYAGAFLVALVTAWTIDRARARTGPPGSAWPLFAAAGLATINNVEFGIAALGASVAALLWSSGPITPHAVARLLRDLALGVVAAIALVCALMLVRAGALPSLDRLLDYPRLYGFAGFGNIRLQSVLGLHLVIYLTYVAAIGVATVRALRGARNRTLTGMLAWSGIFGLGSGSYYMGHSLPDTLTMTFGAWALSLALLTVVTIRAIARHPRRLPTLAQATVLLGFGVAACSLAQLPLPWQQMERIGGSYRSEHDVAPQPEPWRPRAGQRDFYASSAWGRSRFYVKLGAPLAILTTHGHRLADAYGVVNVARYTGVWSLPTVRRLRAVVDDLRAAGGNTLVLPYISPPITETLAAWGFGIATIRGVVSFDRFDTDPDRYRPVDASGYGHQVLKLVDLANLRPRALRGDRGELVATFR